MVIFHSFLYVYQRVMVSNELSKYIVWMQIVAVVLYDQMEWSLETVHNVEGLSFDSLISLIGWHLKNERFTYNKNSLPRFLLVEWPSNRLAISDYSRLQPLILYNFHVFVVSPWIFQQQPSHLHIFTKWRIWSTVAPHSTLICGGSSPLWVSPWNRWWRSSTPAWCCAPMTSDKRQCPFQRAIPHVYPRRRTKLWLK